MYVWKLDETVTLDLNISELAAIAEALRVAQEYTATDVTPGPVSRDEYLAALEGAFRAALAGALRMAWPDNPQKRGEELARWEFSRLAVSQ